MTLLLMLAFPILIGGIYFSVKNSQPSFILEKKLSLSLNLKKEARVRSNWLFSLCASSFVAITMVFTLSNSLNVDSDEKELIKIIALVSLLISAFSSYFFAYLKRGRFFLMFLIVSYPLGRVLFFYEIDHYLQQFQNITFFFLAASFILTGLECIHWINCIKLYKVNVARLKQRKLQIK